MTQERWDELFPDGWREPGDDCERLILYLLFGIGIVVGVAMLGHGLYALARDVGQTARILGLCEAVVGAALAGGGGLILAKEARHWDLRHLSAERVVAGGFLLGIAMVLLGVQIATHAGRAGANGYAEQVRDRTGGLVAGGWLVGLGAADVTIFLVVGLAIAYAPALRLRRRLKGARIERRYALDDKLGEIDDHPCPREDGLTPVIVLRLRDGRMRTLVCAETAYERARVGAGGTAVVRGRRLERFLPG